MKLRQSFNDRIFQLVSYFIVGIFALFCLIPFWLMIMGSITDETELLLSGYSILPRDFSLEAYRALLGSAAIVRSYGITILITVTGTLLGVTISSLLGYSIANKRNRLRHLIAFYVYFTMLFGGGLVPFYILVTKWLQLSDSIWALILPVVIQPFLVFLLVSFFRTLPEELEEAGRMDGANEMKIFIVIMVPISIPIIATVALFYALSYWNDWFNGLLFISSDRMFPLQLILRRLISNMQAAKNLIPVGAGNLVNIPSLGIRMATTVITIGPIVFLYPFIQRYFIKGLTIGSVKG